MMGNKYSFGYVLLLVIYSCIFYISGILGVLQFTLSMIIYTLLFFSIQFCIAKIRKRTPRELLDFIPYFINRFVFVIILFLGILGSFSFYFNAISPAQMTQYTLSNGEKQVVFQEMIHIAKPRFYTQVQDDITAFKQNGGVYFFEGVKPGKKENSDKFDKALGIKFSPDLYKNISKLYGLEYQNNSDFLGLVNDLDFNIDTDLDTVIALYEEKKQKTQAVQEETEIPIDVSEDLIEVLSGLQPRQLTLMIYVNQAIMNAIVQSDGTKDFLQNNFNNQLLFDVILNERNKIVTKQIISGEHKKMFITYGQLHFSGILDLLQESDSNWKIISQKTYYPISKKLDF